jgi:hypothetical protein
MENTRPHFPHHFLTQQNLKFQTASRNMTSVAFIIVIVLALVSKNLSLDPVSTPQQSRSLSASFDSISGLWQYCPPTLAATACIANSTVTAADCATALFPSTSEMGLAVDDTDGSITGTLVYRQPVNGQPGDIKTTGIIGRATDTGFSLLTSGVPGVWRAPRIFSKNTTWEDAAFDPLGSFISFPVVGPDNTVFTTCWRASSEAV